MTDEKVKITNAWLETLTNPAAARTLAELADRQWPVKTAYWLGRILKETERLANDYMEAKTALMRKHAELTSPDPAGRVTVKAWLTSSQAYYTDLRQLLDIEIPLDLPRVSVSLEDIPGHISVNELSLLEPLISISAGDPPMPADPDQSPTDSPAGELTQPPLPAQPTARKLKLQKKSKG